MSGIRPISDGSPRPFLVATAPRKPTESGPTQHLGVTDGTVNTRPLLNVACGRRLRDRVLGRRILRGITLVRVRVPRLLMERALFLTRKTGCFSRHLAFPPMKTPVRRPVFVDIGGHSWSRTARRRTAAVRSTAPQRAPFRKRQHPERHVDERIQWDASWLLQSRSGSGGGRLDSVGSNAIDG